MCVFLALLEETSRSIYDNFIRKGYDRAQCDIELSPVDGKTIRAEVRDEIHVNHQNAEAHPLGKRFYDRVKAKHPLSTSADGFEIEGVGEDIPMNPDLEAALAANKVNGRKKQQVVNAVELLRDPTKRDAHKICEFFTTLPSKAPAQRDMANSLMKWMVERDLKTSWPDLQQMVVGEMDQLMVQALGKYPPHTISKVARERGWVWVVGWWWWW